MAVMPVTPKVNAAATEIVPIPTNLERRE